MSFCPSASKLGIFQLEQCTAEEIVQERSSNCVPLELQERGHFSALHKIKIIYILKLLLTSMSGKQTQEFFLHPVLSLSFPCLNISTFSEIVSVENLNFS